MVLASRGSLGQRGAKLALWSVVALILTSLVCGRRLVAEYHWGCAQSLEGECKYDSARVALQTAQQWLPEFAHLERTWLLLGRLDHRQKRSTPQQRMFAAYQLARNRSRPRAIAYAQDIPWTMTRTQDDREGLGTARGGYDLTKAPGVAETGTRDRRKGYHFEDLIAPNSSVHQAYWFANHWEPLRALRVMDELLAEDAGRQGPVRHQAARMWTNIGLTYYLRTAMLTDAGLVYYEQNRWLTAAEESWQRASQIDPGKRDVLFYLGMIQARADRSRPELVQAAFDPLLKGCADRALRADILNVLGDAYFEAGHLMKARRCYVESFDVYNLPGVDRINYRAQRRLGGL
jgi:tetratricopeptide (TPR) repeat protein